VYDGQKGWPPGYVTGMTRQKSSGVVFAMKNLKTSVLLLCVTAVALSGCLTRSRGNGPDEFRVLTKAPLEVPPEYNLLPPRPGELRPQDMAASEAARRALMGSTSTGDASPGESVLVAAARGDLTETAIRAELDAETNRQTTKPRNFADRILFWRNGDTYIEDGTMLDADMEAERLRREESANKATGGGTVVIRNQRRSIKLPGL